MATLAGSFLQDLASLDEDDQEEEFGVFGSGEGSVATKDRNNNQQQLSLDDDDEKIIDAIKLYEKSQVESVSVVSNLSTKSEFIDLLQKVKQSKTEPPLFANDSSAVTTVLHSSEAQLIEQSNQMIAKLDIEILNIHSFVRDIYSKKFPELESIVASPLEYIAVVQRIKNETELTSIEFTDILPSTVTMAVTVAGSMTTGYPLPPSDLEKVLQACEEAIHLAESRKEILQYLENRMDVIAPNVSAIVGSALAARLISHTNGITQLARMPSQNIMLIGASSSSKGNVGAQGFLGGATTTASGATSTRSIIYGCDIVQITPIPARNRALKLVAGKLGLAARVDSFHESPGGEIGRALREHILTSLTKAQEPPPAPLKKALPTPDDAPKSRRGGKRYRKSKEKYGLSDFRKEANRLVFGPEAEEELDLEGELSLGLVNKGYGNLRLQNREFKVQAKRQKRLQRQVTGTRSSIAISQSNFPSSGATGGISSSLAFTPLQGIELCNPGARTQQTTHKKESHNNPEYFSTAVTFVKTEGS